MDDANVVADDAGDDGKQWCQVYDKNDFFTVVVQLALAFLALASLYLKRLREVPRRTFRTWFLDVSKQGFGACYAHVMNMVSPVRGGGPRCLAFVVSLTIPPIHLLAFHTRSLRRSFPTTFAAKRSCKTNVRGTGSRT